MPTTRDALLLLLDARPGLSQADLAARVGVSTRTARRHLDAMRRAALVDVDRDGTQRRYRLTPEAHLAVALPRLSEAEVEALSVATAAARAVLASTPLAAPLAAAADKLRAAALADVFSFEPETDAAHWSFDGALGGEPPACDTLVFRTLVAAGRDGHAVRADYYTASRRELRTGRRLGPLGVCVRGGTWFVPCVDLDAAARPVKDFALGGFRAARALAERVERPAGFSLDAHTRDRWGALDGPVETVRLLATPEAAPYFERKLYSPTQQIDARHADGSAVVSFEAGGLDAVASFVLSWGPKVRALEPPALVAQVANAHRRAASQYADA